MRNPGNRKRLFCKGLQAVGPAQASPKGRKTDRAILYGGPCVRPPSPRPATQGAPRGQGGNQAVHQVR